MAPANDFFSAAQTLAEEVGTLRACISKLEAALRAVIHESEHTLHSWKERADRNAETARAALKGE